MCFAASNQSAFLKHGIFKLCKKLFMKSGSFTWKMLNTEFGRECHGQCDQIGQFLKSFWRQILVQKQRKYLENLGAIFERPHLLTKNCFVYFLGNFWKNLDTCYFNMWSHWKQARIRRFLKKQPPKRGCLNVVENLIFLSYNIVLYFQQS